jgi:hypothetical protein
MKGSLLIYLLQFFSGIIILAIILMSSTIISYHIFQRNWINSKLQVEVLSSIVSSLSSSSLDYNVTIRVGRECDVTLKPGLEQLPGFSTDYYLISGGTLKSWIGNSEYMTITLVPEYIRLKNSESFCRNGLLYIHKKGDEIWLE